MQDPKEFITLIQAYRDALDARSEATMDAQSWAIDNDDFFKGFYDLSCNTRLDAERTSRWTALQNAEHAAGLKLAELEESIMEMVRNPDITTAVQANMIVKERNLELKDTISAYDMIKNAHGYQFQLGSIAPQLQHSTMSTLQHIAQFTPKKRTK